MKISDLIKELQKIQKEHGDIETWYQSGYDWYDTDNIKFHICGKILYFE